LSFESVNPATEERLESYESLDAEGLEARLARAEEAAARQRRTDPAERAACLERAAELLDQGAGAYGRLMSLEMGKPLDQAVAEVEKCAWVCRHYAEHGAAALADEIVQTEADESRVRYRPLGPVLAIMPWNYPFWQVFRFAAPALMAGNVGLLKHAPNVPQCALAIEGVLRRAGFPEGAFQNLFLEVEQVEAALADPRVRAATLTGSVGAGSAVAAAAGRSLKKTVLELGGSDPFVVTPSADVEAAVETAVRARCQNNGQSCIAAKRFVLVGEIADEFRDAMVARFESLEVGDPLREGTEVGPLAREDLRDELARQVSGSVEAGARLLAGGEAPDRPGWFYRPAILSEIPREAPAYGQELFGPVAALFRTPDLEAAIEIANDSEFGLGAAIWTRDADERDRFLDRIEAGVVAVNGMVASDPRLPFGGVKRSGYGRELGRHGIREFVNVQTVNVESP